MIEIADSDSRLLEDFPLKWRWTDERWNKLPSVSLAQINPLANAKAEEIYKSHLKYLSHDGFDKDFIEQREMIRTESADFSVIQNWLKNLISDQSAKILVSWCEDLAVQTTGEIFCDYWNDFCYPASDDVSVSPADLSWLLFYHHDEFFCFGKVKKELI